MTAMVKYYDGDASYAVFLKIREEHHPAAVPQI